MVVCIILTTTVYPQNKSFIFQKDPISRIKSYTKSIQQWSQSTTLPIFVVENSGYQFVEQPKGIQFISYNESEIFPQLAKNDSKGTSEMYSISYAKQFLPKDCTFVIKITGRYFIPNFEKYIKCIHGYDILCQNNYTRCEIVGCHFKNFDIFFNVSPDLDNHIEFLYKKRVYKFDKIYHLPIIPITPTPMGGINKIVESL